MANVTADELESAKNKKHDLDNKTFIDAIKKIVKSRSIRINTYIDKEVNDGFMLKVQVEKFIKGKSMGSRMIKGYLSTSINDELMKLIDAIPRKSYVDTRDGTTKERPLKIVKVYQEALTDIDLATLWNADEK